MTDNIEDANHTRGPCPAEKRRFFLSQFYLANTLSQRLGFHGFREDSLSFISHARVSPATLYRHLPAQRAAPPVRHG